MDARVQRAQSFPRFEGARRSIWARGRRGGRPPWGSRCKSPAPIVAADRDPSAARAAPLARERAR
eukprot:9481923-Pyramimonas_sp.AAC.1